MRKPPDKPCEGCEHAPCQLPLNCAHYLRYQQELRQYWSDKALLKSARLRKVEDALLLKSTQKKREQWAEECPWEAPAERKKVSELAEPEYREIDRILDRIRAVWNICEQNDSQNVKTQFANLAYTILREGLAKEIEASETGKENAALK